MFRIKWIRETLGTTLIFWGIFTGLTSFDGWVKDPNFFKNFVENIHRLTGMSQWEAVCGLIMVPVGCIVMGLFVLLNKDLRK